MEYMLHFYINPLPLYTNSYQTFHHPNFDIGRIVTLHSPFTITTRPTRVFISTIRPLNSPKMPRERYDYETLKSFWHWAQDIQGATAQEVSSVEPVFGTTHNGVKITFPVSENLTKETIRAHVHQCKEITEGDIDPRAADEEVGANPEEFGAGFLELGAADFDKADIGLHLAGHQNRRGKRAAVDLCRAAVFNRVSAAGAYPTVR